MRHLGSVLAGLAAGTAVGGDRVMAGEAPRSTPISRGIPLRVRGAHQARSRERRRATDWLCSWHTRDSVTPSTAAISFRFMSCS